MDVTFPNTPAHLRPGGLDRRAFLRLAALLPGALALTPYLPPPPDAPPHFAYNDAERRDSDPTQSGIEMNSSIRYCN